MPEGSSPELRITPPRQLPPQEAISSPVMPMRRGLKRVVSNMSDDDVKTLPYLAPRRRLRGKQSAPLSHVAHRKKMLDARRKHDVGLAVDLELPLTESSINCQFISLYQHAGIDVLETRIIDRNRVRSIFRGGFLKYNREYCRNLLNSKNCPAACRKSNRSYGWQLSYCADALLTKLSVTQRMVLCRKILADLTSPDQRESRLDLLAWMYKQDFKKDLASQQESKKRFVHAAHVLFTWNGDFGLIDSTYMQGLLKKPTLLLGVLKKRPDVKDICHDLHELAVNLLGHYHLAHASCSLELCTQTLEDERLIRLHAHMMLQHQYGQTISCKTSAPFLFRGCIPNKSIASLGHAIGTNSCHKASVGHYYLLMPKIGKVWCWGSLAPFKDFRVNPDHVMAFVQSGKMTIEDAMSELLKTYKDAEKHIGTLEFCKRKLAMVATEQRISDRVKQLARTRFPRRRIPIVDDVFLPHMAQVLDRHRFLVLDGPSQVGKTTFCKLLSQHPDGYVEIDCSGLTVAPNLHVLTHHTDVICFDECPPSYVAKYRKLFQGPEKAVNLGDTQSSRFSYSADLWGIKMVVCSNNWMGKLEAMEDVTAREWIVRNSFYHYCDQPLWVEPDEVAPVVPPAESHKALLPLQGERGLSHSDQLSRNILRCSVMPLFWLGSDFVEHLAFQAMPTPRVFGAMKSHV